MTEQDIWQQIAAPLNPKQVKSRKQGNQTIYYISREDVINRLNAVCPGEWTFEIEIQSVNPWVVKGRLTIRGVTREDLGVPPNEQHFDPPKAAASDALKRCASQFGFAIELYGEDYEGDDQPVPQKKQKQETQKPGIPIPADKVRKATFTFQRSKCLCDFDNGDWSSFWANAPDYFEVTDREYFRVIVHSALGVDSAKESKLTAGEAFDEIGAFLSVEQDNAA
jgi:hypothetical protein